jgi:hypothetical protein
MHFSLNKPEYSTEIPILESHPALKMLNEIPLEKFGSISDLGSFESPKATSKFEFIYKKHFPDKIETDAHSLISATTKSTLSMVSLSKKITTNSKVAHNMMNKLLEEIKNKSYKPFMFP